MSAAEVLVVPTGAANLASVRAALARLGVAHSEDATPARVERSDAVILPGVGAFGSAMMRLREAGLADALRERAESGGALLAICLGFQLLCRSSEESPGVEGLGILDRTITRFNGELRVPHMGWNQVRPDDGCVMIDPGDAYFANSYRLVDAPADWSCATCDYGGAFTCAIERGGVLGCQFHPELSGPWGLALLRRWLTSAGVATC